MSCEAAVETDWPHLVRCSSVRSVHGFILLGNTFVITDVNSLAADHSRFFGVLSILK